MLGLAKTAALTANKCPKILVKCIFCFSRSVMGLGFWVLTSPWETLMYLVMLWEQDAETLCPAVRFHLHPGKENKGLPLQELLLSHCQQDLLP